jgi:hypothetical protein
MHSLKPLASVGIAIEGPSQQFERPESLFGWPGQPIRHGIVTIGQLPDGKLRTVQPEVLGVVVGRTVHNASLPNCGRYRE